MSEILTNCKFYFQADGIEDKMIMEVSGLTAESTSAGGDQVLGSKKGGLNLRQATPTRVKFSQLTVKMVATSAPDLYKWFSDCHGNEGESTKWTENRKTVMVTAYDQAGEEVAAWTAINAYPTKYEGPSFSASGSDIATETISVVHEGVKRTK